MRDVPAKPEHEALLAAMKAPIGVEGANMQAEDILAVAAILVGQLIAVQDRRRYSSEAVMAMVAANIEKGNARAIDDLLGPGGRA